MPHLLPHRCSSAWAIVDILAATAALHLHGMSSLILKAPLGQWQHQKSESLSRSDFALQCRSYLQGLLSYLESFYERTSPLGNLAKVYSKLEQDFDNSFEEGQVQGWEDRGAGRLPGEQENAIDLQAFDTVEELESLGEALAAVLACHMAT